MCKGTGRLPIHPLPPPHLNSQGAYRYLCLEEGSLCTEEIIVYNLGLNKLLVVTVAKAGLVAYGYMGCGAMDFLGTNFLVGR